MHLERTHLVQVPFDYIVDVCFPQINRYCSSLVDGCHSCQIELVFTNFGRICDICKLSTTATLSHSFLLLRTSRTDNGSFSAVLISVYWNAYSEGCGTETNAMSLTTIFSRFSGKVKSISSIGVPIRLAFGKQLPFVFWLTKFLSAIYFQKIL